MEYTRGQIVDYLDKAEKILANCKSQMIWHYPRRKHLITDYIARLKFTIDAVEKFLSEDATSYVEAFVFAASRGFNLRNMSSGDTNAMLKAVAGNFKNINYGNER